MQKIVFQYFIVLTLSLIIIPGILIAGETKPTDTVRKLLESISMIKDGATVKLSQKEIDDNKKLTKKATSLIDIPILGPKTLGSHWNKLNEKEKKLFLSLLKRLFEKIAYPNSAKFFKDLNVVYDNEIINKGKAEVKTSMEHESEGLIEIDFKLHKIDNRWIIYDVILDGVSLLYNLKTKFHKVIDEESFKELQNRIIKRLNRKD